MKRKVVIDTDPGKDDVVAILLALAAADELDVLAIVTVAGNVPLHLTQENARKACELAGFCDVPVYAGCARPMSRPGITAEQVHGESGIGGLRLPEPTIPLQSKQGVDFLIETLSDADAASITLCALGPLTNIGTALVKAPQIIGKVRELVMMGGACFEVGNITPAAEFNIYVDPHAAELVTQSGMPVVMIPLDATHQVLSTPLRIERLRALGNRCGVSAAKMLAFVEAGNFRFGSEGMPLHDPCVIAYLLRPELFQGRTVNVTIETQSQLTLGMTIVDWWGVTGRRPNVKFINAVDGDAVFDLLTERIARLP